MQISAQRVAELEQSRNLSRLWLHVDMDAFYAAVEALECPELATKPMAVGGLSMICTANYEVLPSATLDPYCHKGNISAGIAKYRRFQPPEASLDHCSFCRKTCRLAGYKPVGCRECGQVWQARDVSRLIESTSETSLCPGFQQARKYGVRAAMPGFIAVKLCPDLVFVRADFQKYQRYSDMSRTGTLT